MEPPSYGRDDHGECTILGGMIDCRNDYAMKRLLLSYFCYSVEFSVDRMSSQSTTASSLDHSISPSIQLVLDVDAPVESGIYLPRSMNVPM